MGYRDGSMKGNSIGLERNTLGRKLEEAPSNTSVGRAIYGGGTRKKAKEAGSNIYHVELAIGAVATLFFKLLHPDIQATCMIPFDG